LSIDYKANIKNLQNTLTRNLHLLNANFLTTQPLTLLSLHKLLTTTKNNAYCQSFLIENKDDYVHL